MTIQPVKSPAPPVDLRRVGIHPDYWYPIAWADEIKHGKTLGRSFAGEAIVLYRTGAGEVVGLEDRCAHRQVPLHLGKIENDRLRCGYHGWAYDRSGHCVDVPYLGSEHVCNAVKSYPVREVDGIVFLFPGEAALAATKPVPQPGMRANDSYKTRRLSRDVACHYSFMHENLFDMNHQFLHRRNMGLIRTRCLDRRSGDGWCEVDYAFTRAAGRGSVGEGVILSLARGADEESRNEVMTIRTEYPYQRLKFWIDEGDPVLDVWLCYSPLDAEQRSNRTFGHLSVKKPGMSFLLHAAWPFVTWFTERIFAEDQEIVEREQAAHDAQGSDWNNEVFPPILDLRRLLAEYGGGLTPAPA